MKDWFTDRLPTEADGDSDGEVVVLARFNESDDTVEALVHWSRVKSGTTWRHTCFWRPAKPAPEPEPEVADPEPAPEAPAEPESTPTAEIPEPIRTGAAQFYVVVVSNDMRGKPGGNPIVWEHTIPKTTTLQAALRQQRRVGSRYGTTYVAECRIIPELARDAA